jgi:hypothetical protein
MRGRRFYLGLMVRDGAKKRLLTMRDRNRKTFA